MSKPQRRAVEEEEEEMKKIVFLLILIAVLAACELDSEESREYIIIAPPEWIRGSWLDDIDNPMFVWEITENRAIKAAYLTGDYWAEEDPFLIGFDTNGQNIFNEKSTHDNYSFCVDDWVFNLDIILEFRLIETDHMYDVFYDLHCYR